MRYTCKYYSGGGTEYDGGLWEKKETVKTITFTQIEKSFFNPNWELLKINKDETKNRRHCLRDWNDGTYTIYPDQSGTPHVFEPVENSIVNKTI
jgi:hypothetical protein